MNHKKTPPPSLTSDNEELESLCDAYSDALDYNVELFDENVELRRENKSLKDELDSLKQEMAALKKLVRTTSPVQDSTSQPREITREQKAYLSSNGLLGFSSSFAQDPIKSGPKAALSLNERVTIFRRLFRGRDDVYAKRWESQQGKAGYSPACAMEWKRPHCTKPQKKCTACHYAPLTDEILASHLAGNITIGVYALLPDDTCRFLAADFDGDAWLSDAAAYLKTCRSLNISAYLERSRSGNGGHVWIFFEQPIQAALARKLGSAVLTKTMEERHEIKFATYDRFFPNQDTMPRGGFGNLIALPLQGKSMRHGNSAFLDDNFAICKDQWDYLQSIQHVSVEQAEEIVADAERNGSVVGVRLSLTDDEQQDPWTQPPTKKRSEKRIPGLLPQSVRLVQGNMLYVEKEGLSPAFINRLKRIAAFQNPEFYKAKAMRVPIYKIPRVIGCSDDFDRYIGLPRGLLDEVKNLFADHGIEIKLADERFLGKPFEVSFKGELRQDQALAVADLLKHDLGLLSATTAFGKTVVGAWMIAARKTNTLILVHRQELLDQWRERLSTFLNATPTSIGQIGGGKNKPNGFLDIGMIQSLARGGEVKDIVADYGQVIVDECHHVAAVSFERILKQVKAKYVLGLTATPTRKDGLHPIMIMQCGPIRHRVGAKQQAAKRPFEHIVFPRSTSFEYPATDVNYQDLCGLLANDPVRNELIISDILKVLAEGRNPLVLTERREHVDLIASRLSAHVRHLVTMYGGRTKKERQECIQRLKNIPQDENRVLVATGKYIGEGFDDPKLDTLFLALPISWKGTLQQYAGRLHRVCDGKLEVRVYDYVDANVSMAWAMYEKRKKGYAAMGYFIEANWA